MRRFAREMGIGASALVLDIGGTPECWGLMEVPPRVVLLNLPQSIEKPAGAELRVAGTAGGCRFATGRSTWCSATRPSSTWAGGPARRVCTGSGAGGTGLLDPDAEPLVSGGATLADAVHSLAAEAVAARYRSAVQFLELAVARDARPPAVLYPPFSERYTASGPGEMRRLFPGARLIRERFCGITKSLIAARKP